MFTIAEMENNKFEMSANMSVYSARTGLSSILKSYSTVEREKAKAAVINKVRFEMPKEHGVAGAIEAVLNYNDYMIYNEFVSFLKESSLTVSWYRPLCVIIIFFYSGQIRLEFSQKIS